MIMSTEAHRTPRRRAQQHQERREPLIRVEFDFEEGEWLVQVLHDGVQTDCRARDLAEARRLASHVLDCLERTRRSK
jgi:hypothetical protein